MGYNNDPRTTFTDIQEVFGIVEPFMSAVEGWRNASSRSEVAYRTSGPKVRTLVRAVRAPGNIIATTASQMLIPVRRVLAWLARRSHIE